MEATTTATLATTTTNTFPEAIEAKRQALVQYAGHRGLHVGIIRHGTKWLVTVSITVDQAR